MKQKFSEAVVQVEPLRTVSVSIFAIQSAPGCDASAVHHGQEKNWKCTNDHSTYRWYPYEDLTTSGTNKGHSEFRSGMSTTFKLAKFVQNDKLKD